MPLPDNKWTRGKCGFKGLQYMSINIPCVMAPVGVNTDIIRNGKNGFLPANDNEWFNVLSTLIENRSMREKIGNEGKNTIITNYSTESNKSKYLEAFNSVFL